LSKEHAVVSSRLLHGNPSTHKASNDDQAFKTSATISIYNLYLGSKISFLHAYNVYRYRSTDIDVHPDIFDWSFEETFAKRDHPTFHVPVGSGCPGVAPNNSGIELGSDAFEGEL